MTAREDTYFGLLRIGLHLSEASGVELATLQSGIKWPEIYALAVAQGTSAFIWDALHELNLMQALPSSLRIEWAYKVDQIEKRYDKQKKALTDLAVFLAAQGIPLMVIKGYGLSLCYPRPEHRECGDIDIWLFGKQQQADELIKKEFGIQIDEDKHHHTVFTFGGVMVENHFDFLNVHAHASNRDIERELYKYVQAGIRKVEVGGTEIMLPPTQFNALFLLRHAAAHFAAEKIGIRHVADWAMFVQHDAKAIQWEELYSVARRMNMDRFLNCLNAISIDCLGLSRDLFPDFERDPKLEERVLNDILHPEFDKKSDDLRIIPLLRFKFHRWMANRWKHRIVYRESLTSTFFRQIYSHLLKPQSFKH